MSQSFPNHGHAFLIINQISVLVLRNSKPIIFSAPKTERFVLPIYTLTSRWKKVHLLFCYMRRDLVFVLIAFLKSAGIYPELQHLSLKMFVTGATITINGITGWDVAFFQRSLALLCQAKHHLLQDAWMEGKECCNIQWANVCCHSGPPNRGNEGQARERETDGERGQVRGQEWAA